MQQGFFRWRQSSNCTFCSKSKSANPKIKSAKNFDIFVYAENPKNVTKIRKIESFCGELKQKIGYFGGKSPRSGENFEKLA